MPGLTVICGKPGSGKTTLMGRALAQEHTAGSPVVAFDPTGDIARVAADHGVPVGRIAVFHGELPSKIEKHLADETNAERAPFVVIRDDDARRILKCARTWIGIAVHMRRGWVYACDESELLFPNVPHGEKDDGPSKTAILTIARNRGCRIMLATKRPQRLHVDARENATHVCVFRSDSESYIEGCANFMNQRAFAKVASLARGQYLYRGPFESTSQLEVCDSLGRVPFDPLLAT